ncbi:MAG: sialidase family protein [Polyangiales bacterium]|nr:exo-alpha-sialidase [Myxococcales bacterium]
MDSDMPPDIYVPLNCPGTDPMVSVECNGNSQVCCVNAQGAPTCVARVTCFSPFLCDDASIEQPSADNNCTFRAPLNPGQLATHLDIATAADGTVMLSGYSAGIAPRSRFGDLVVGRVENGEVSWSIIDGVPEGTPLTQGGFAAIESGWRGGILPAGDNVGEFNAIAFNGNTVAISYYDRTNGDLKYASSTDGGTTWSIHTVFTDGDSGRYSSLAFMVDGRPAISFLTMMPSEDPGQPAPGCTQGCPRSLPRVAVASSLTPSSAADWVTFPIVAEPGTAIACRADLCGDGLVCRADGGCGLTSADADIDCSHVDSDGVTQPGCGSGTRCLSAADGVTFSCSAVTPDEFIEDVPEVNGLYTALRATNTGLALVWHDRVRRTLLGSAFDASNMTWRAPFRIDGFDAGRGGDSGYNADLFIDAAGNWHVVYVDGAFEELRHAQIDGTTLGNANPNMVRTMIDDGTRPPRERSIIGSDADIAVLASGEVRVVYQDSTQSEALLAVREAGQTAWILQGGTQGDPLDDTDSTGYWTTQALGGDTSFIATWWFNANEGTNGTRVFTIP